MCTFSDFFQKHRPKIWAKNYFKNSFKKFDLAFTFPRCLDVLQRIDCGSKFQNSFKFAYGQIGPGNDGWWYFRVKFMQVIPTIYGDVRFGQPPSWIFSKGVNLWFWVKISKCVYGQIGPGNDVWCFRVVTLWSWPYLKISRTLTLAPIIAEHMIGFLPPSRCCWTVRVLLWDLIVLSATKSYSEGFIKASLLTPCRLDRITLLDSSE